MIILITVIILIVIVFVILVDWRCIGEMYLNLSISLSLRFLFQFLLITSGGQDAEDDPGEGVEQAPN